MYTQTTFPVIDLARTGRSIELHRRQAGLAVRDLQTYFGFEYPQAIYKWQHGECLPTVDNLLALARLLRVNMEDLLVWNDPGDPPFLGVPRENIGGTERNILPVPLFLRVSNLSVIWAEGAINCPFRHGIPESADPFGG